MKKLFGILLALSLCLCLSVGALAADDYIINESDAPLEDFFSDEELDELNDRAEDIWEKEGVAPYFILVDDTDGMSTGDYSEWYYMEHDFIPVNAIVMIANIEQWETKVYADGDICLDKLVVDDLNAMKDAYDEAETYYGGVKDYLAVVQKTIGFNMGMALVIALIAGLVIGVAVALILRAQLKTVRAKNSASDYTRPGSMVITSRYENFLYRTVDRTEKAQNDGGGGGGGKTGGGLRSD